MTGLLAAARSSCHQLRPWRCDFGPMKREHPASSWDKDTLFDPGGVERQDLCAVGVI